MCKGEKIHIPYYHQDSVKFYPLTYIHQKLIYYIYYFIILCFISGLKDFNGF